MKWILLPIISALIGWFTNYIAIKLLFWPVEPFNFLGFKIQGVFIKNQKMIASKLKEIIEDKLLRPEHLSELLESKLNQFDLDTYIEKEVTTIVQDFSSSGNVLKQLYLNQKRQQVFIEQILELIAKKIEQLREGNNLATQIESLELGKQAQQVVEKMDPLEIKDLIDSIVKQELKFIEILGAILGFLIGLIQTGLIQIIQ